MARHVVRTQKKAKLWQGIPSIQLAMAANGTFAGPSLPFTSPQTVIRMLGEYVVTVTATPAAADAAKVGVGLAKVSTDAFGAGATALPDPISDPDFPWLYWAVHVFAFPVANQTDSNQSITGSLRHRYDIRSMRKFTANESLVLVAQYEDLSGAPPLLLSTGNSRILTTLH